MIHKNILYFPNSPVNIISLVCLADHFNDDNGTYVTTRRIITAFTWDHGNYIKSLAHSENRLPEIMVNKDYNTLQTCKIRDILPASAFSTFESILPEDMIYSTNDVLSANNLAFFAGADIIINI